MGTPIATFPTKDLATRSKKATFATHQLPWPAAAHPDVCLKLLPNSAGSKARTFFLQSEKRSVPFHL